MFYKVSGCIIILDSCEEEFINFSTNFLPPYCEFYDDLDEAVKTVFGDIEYQLLSWTTE